MIIDRQLLLVAAVFLFAAFVVELIAYRYLKRSGYGAAEAMASLFLGLAHTITGFVEAGIIIAVSYFFWDYRLADVPKDAWWGWLALFLGFELAYYWWHRAAHAVRWLWASHAVHHSPERLNILATARVVVSDLLSARWLFMLPLVFIGFEPGAVFIVVGLSHIYQIWIHTELIPKLGPLEYILDTPSNHRVHHARNAEYINHNYGSTLIVFDRIFGTYVEERSDVPCRYGLLGETKPNNPVWVVLHEWIAMARYVQRSASFREALGYVFGRPGWNPAWLPEHSDNVSSRNVSENTKDTIH